jgi:hypothetical protein
VRSGCVTIPEVPLETVLTEPIRVCRPHLSASSRVESVSVARRRRLDANCDSRPSLVALRGGRVSGVLDALPVPPPIDHAEGHPCQSEPRPARSIVRSGGGTMQRRRSVERTSPFAASLTGASPRRALLGDLARIVERD